MELIFLTEKLLRQYYKLVIYPLVPLLCQSIWWHYRFKHGKLCASFKCQNLVLTVLCLMWRNFVRLQPCLLQHRLRHAGGSLHGLHLAQARGLIPPPPSLSDIISNKQFWNKPGDVQDRDPGLFGSHGFGWILPLIADWIPLRIIFSQRTFELVPVPVLCVNALFAKTNN